MISDATVGLRVCLLQAVLLLQMGCGGDGGLVDPKPEEPPEDDPPTPWVNGPDWTTYQGNAAHSGYVPIVLDPDDFEAIWTAAPGPALSLTQPTTSGGRVFLATEGRTTGNLVVALDVNTGQAIWTRTFAAYALNAPAVAGDRVYVTTTGWEDTALWALDAATGDILFRSGFASQLPRYLAPVAVDGTIYTPGGYYGGLHAFDATTGTQRWWTAIAQYEEWTPAVAGGTVYAFTNNYLAELTTFDAATGAERTRWRPTGRSWSTATVRVTPTLMQDGSVLVPHLGTLIRFGNDARSVQWERPGEYLGPPVVVGDAAYVVNGNELEAVRLTDATRIWGAAMPQGLHISGALVATDSLVFTARGGHTVAFRRSTGEAVWSHPAGGRLAISREGVLIIASRDGTLAAVRLHRSQEPATR